MNKVAILSITLLASITLAIPNVYAEEGGFFDWLFNLFGGFEENESVTSEIIIEDETTSKIRKAAIIDQLARDIPNLQYQNQTMSYLLDAGYDVDLYTTEDITIDFYKELPSMDYEFIVLRSHSLAIYGKKPSEWLFSGELYSNKVHIAESLSGQLSPGVPFVVTEDQTITYSQALRERHFMIGSKFIEESMVGQFPGSVIILGGCETMPHELLAEALVKRGASSVIGWNELVGSASNDKVITSLLEEMLVNGLKIDEAIDLVMDDYKKDKKSSLRLKHFSSGVDVEI